MEGDVKSNEARFCHCMSSKRINHENVDLLLSRTGDSVTVDVDSKSSDTLCLQSYLSVRFSPIYLEVLVDNLTTS